MGARSIAFADALDELASLFHRIAIVQTVPGAGVADADVDAERIAAFAAQMTPEDVQLAYQICVQGRADLALAPDEATGFSMTLLRLLAFAPGGGMRPGGPDGDVAPAPARGGALKTRTAVAAATASPASVPLVSGDTVPNAVLP